MVGIIQVLLDIRKRKTYYNWVHLSMHNELVEALNRAGEKVYPLAQVTPERGGGYGWYAYWPEPLLSNKYPQGKQYHNKCCIQC